MNEVWLFDRENGTIRQITGYSGLHGVTQSWNNIEWLDASSILFSRQDDMLIRLNTQ